MKPLQIAITDGDKQRFRAVFRQRDGRVDGETYLQRLVYLHRAQVEAAKIRGDPDELDSAEADLVLKAAERLLARDRRTDFGEILREMETVRRTDPPPGIPKKRHWISALLSFEQGTR